MAPCRIDVSAWREPKILPPAQPPTAKAKKDPHTLSTRAHMWNFLQLTICASWYAPMAVPINPKMRPTARAARAPTQTADQFTGQLTVSHRSMPLGSGIALLSCRLREGTSCAATLSRFLTAGLEPRKNFGLVELHEAGLVGTNLVDANMVIARVGVLLERVEMPLGIRATDHGLGYGVFCDELRHRLAVSGEGQLPGEGSIHGLNGPPLPCHLPRLGFILAPAHSQLAVAGPAGPP